MNEEFGSVTVTSLARHCYRQQTAVVGQSAATKSGVYCTHRRPSIGRGRDNEGGSFPSLVTSSLSKQWSATRTSLTPPTDAKKCAPGHEPKERTVIALHDPLATAMIGEICSVDWLGQRLLDTSCVDSSMSNETGNAKLLILDCRSPDEYSLSHVIGSLFVAIPSIVHRRLRNGRCPASAAINAIGVIGGGMSIDRGGCASGLVELTDCCRRSDRVVLYDSGVDGAENSAAAGSSASIIDVLLRLLTAERCSISRLEGLRTIFHCQNQ